MHIRIAAGDNIFNDATQGGGIQSVPIDTLADTGDRFEWWRMADLDDGPFVDTKRLPGGFRETDLVPREELAIDLEERCGDRPTTVADIDLGVRSKAFSMTDRTVAPHDGDQLMMRVETQTACAREGRFDLAWDIEKVLRLQRSGAAAGRNLLHVAMTTFNAWEAAAFEKVS